METKDMKRRSGSAWASVACVPVLVAVMIGGATLGIRVARASAGDSHPTETVAAPGKWIEAVSDVASPISVITGDEIRALGYRTLGEVMQWVRGTFVTSDRVYSYLGVRGIQRPGDFNNKVLLMIDGHTMNGNVFGDAYFDASLGIDLDLVERIEVVHGPDSEIYGSGAALAVVNVIMRHADAGSPASISGRTGTAGHRQALATFGAERPGRPAIFASLSWLEARGLDHYYPEFDSPLTAGGRAIDADGERSRAFFGTADWLGMHVAAKFNERVKRIPTASFGTVFGDNRYRAYDGHDFIEVSAARSPSPAVDLFARAYWDHAHYHATYVFDYGSGPVLNHDSGQGEAAGAEWRGRWVPRASRQVVTGGVEAQVKGSARLSNYDLDPYASYLDTREARTLFALYAQDRVRLGRDLHFTAGARVDRCNRFDPEWSPGVGMAWRDPHGTEWKLAASRAFRAPNPYETSYEATSVLRSRNLGPEHVGTLAATATRQMGPARVLLTAYASEVRDVIDLVEIDSLGTLQYRNSGRVECRGVEGQADFEIAPGTRWRFALARQSSTTDNQTLTNSPAWNAHLLVVHEPLRGKVSTGAGIRYLSPRVTRTGRNTAAEFVADARLGVHIGRWALAGLEARNLFDARYGDPASGEFVQEQILQDPRALFLTVTLRSRDTP